MKDVIILPTYNERENIGNIVPMIFSVVPDIYILVADDNSPDGTADVVRELQKKYKRLDLISRPQKNGLGRAYINAFKHVLKDTDVRTVIMMDADLSHQPKYLPEMLKKSYDFSVVTGSRYVKGGETVGWETWRVILSFLGNFYCRNITGMPIMDCTAGFNVISTDLLRKIDFSNIDMSGYAFIMELKYNLHLAGGEFYEVPITFVNRVGGESKMSSHIISEGVVAPWKMRFKVQSEKIEEDVKKINCVGCLSKEKVFFGIKNNLPLYKCLGCGMLSLYELPESSSEVYDAEYFSGGSGGFGYVNYDEDKEPMRESFKKYLDLIKKVSGKSGKLFDVGAAT
ncbi:MAG: polyprenol monophosphomannose synthase, partial [Nitrospira sp.]